MKNSDLIRSKRHRFDYLPNSSVYHHKKHRAVIVNTAHVHIQPLGLPLFSTITGSPSESLRLEQYRPHTIGRSRRHCDSVFEDRRVSKKHFQILFDALNRKICIADGVLWFGSNGSSWVRVSGSSRVRVSSNGVFVNGVRIERGEVAELGAGDEVSLVCGNEGVCGLGFRIGFIVHKIVFVEEVFHGNLATFSANGMSSGYASARSQCGKVTATLNKLLSNCRQILHSNDPIWCIRKCIVWHRVNSVLGSMLSSDVEFPIRGVPELRSGVLVEHPFSEGSHVVQRLENVNANLLQLSSINHRREITVVSEVNPASECPNVTAANDLQEVENVDAPPVANGKAKTMNLDSMVKENTRGDENQSASISPPGNGFYLNRLQSMGHGSVDHQNVVSLPELLHPVESLSQIFIATFTSDIVWFLSYCEIPCQLPVTIACHNREKCWSSNPDQRISAPFSDFPNLVVV
ncbi:hypothetical protein U1Q18_006921 [Sarracenia purpurea var. burkii]